ncbi:MAG: hypothetical protein ACRDTC_26220 [Pseudonocardiaceae bacterium]
MDSISTASGGSVVVGELAGVELGDQRRRRANDARSSVSRTAQRRDWTAATRPRAGDGWTGER